jgi:hypothetical protein
MPADVKEQGLLTAADQSEQKASVLVLALEGYWIDQGRCLRQKVTCADARAS